MNQPSPAAVQHFFNTTAAVSGLTAFLTHPGDIAAASECVRRLTEAQTDAKDCVRGNRPADMTATWTDLRLILAGTLRECLRELDAAEGPR